MGIETFSERIAIIFQGINDFLLCKSKGNPNIQSKHALVSLNTNYSKIKNLNLWNYEVKCPLSDGASTYM